MYQPDEYNDMPTKIRIEMDQIFSDMCLSSAHLTLVDNLEQGRQEDIRKRSRDSFISCNPFDPFMMHFCMYEVANIRDARNFIKLHEVDIATYLQSTSAKQPSYVVIFKGGNHGMQGMTARERVHNVTDLRRFKIRIITTADCNK